MADPKIETENDELRSIRDATRELGSLVEALERGELEKVVVTKHGRMAAVILPLETYAKTRPRSLEDRAREREEMLEKAPTCRTEGCEEKVVEEEVCATIRLPKYPDQPEGPLGDPRPTAYLERCTAGHEFIRNVDTKERKR